MKHFYCAFRFQCLNLHKNWHISFLLVAKSEILYISVIDVGFKVCVLAALIIEVKLVFVHPDISKILFFS